MSQTLTISELSIAANTTNNNVLSGTTIEWQGKASVLTLYGNGDAVGITHTLFMNDGTSVLTIVPPNSGLGAASTVGKIKVNEDFILQYPIPAGERLVHSVTNTTGAAVKVNFMYVLT